MICPIGKGLLLTSTGSRHAYIAHRLAASLGLALILAEEKGLDNSFKDDETGLISKHFEKLGAAESQFFSEYDWASVETEVITVERGGLNNEEMAKRVEALQPEFAVVFGCGVLKPPLISVLPHRRTINLHQGLSPYMRGSGTNFWAFVEETPELIGVTVHFLDQGIDTGDIIAHGQPEIRSGDTLFSLGFKTVQVSADLAVDAIKAFRRGDELLGVPQWTAGKHYQRKDLNEDAIRKLARLEAEGFIDNYLADRAEGKVLPLNLIYLVSS